MIGGDLDDLDELRIRSPLRYWYARISRDRLLRRARRIIVVTNEIARHPAIVGLHRPVSVLPNSINLAAYPELEVAHNPSPRLVFIGSPRLAWAGVDKIARLASHFPSWRFDLVGPAQAELPDCSFQRRRPRPAGPRRVHADHGRRGRRYRPLALHRKGLSEASALKVAEYLACGIPVIVGNSETAFPGGAPFLLQLAEPRGQRRRFLGRGR